MYKIFHPDAMKPGITNNRPEKEPQFVLKPNGSFLPRVCLIESWILMELLVKDALVKIEGRLELDLIDAVQFQFVMGLTWGWGQRQDFGSP